MNSLDNFESIPDMTDEYPSRNRRRRINADRSMRNQAVAFASFLLLLSSAFSEAFATSFYPEGNNPTAATRFGVPRGGSLSPLESSKSQIPVNGVTDGGEEPSDHKVNGSSKKNIKNASVNGFGTTTMIQSVMEEGKDKSFPCHYVAETNLPTGIGNFRLRAYRVDENLQKLQKNKYIGSEPCLIYSADKPPFGGGENGKAVPVRIHDQCFTSEVFGSMRCDCREQLIMSLEYVKKNGGAVIYLQQEGRGIGIANKIAAYALQDVGFDTVDANVHLGLPEDCRQYGVVPSILKDMQIESIRLLSNNPRKVERLTALGIDIVDSVPMVVEQSNQFNKKYLQTKQDRMRHANFQNMLQKKPLKLRTANGGMLPKKRKFPAFSIADDYINAGEEMAANAITSALIDETTTDDEGEEMAGVTADNEGYCFGRESVEEAIEAVARGEIVVVVDDMDRENEGDFIMAADLATPETIATFIRFSSGVLCIGMEGERMDELKLPAMVSNSEDPKETAFSVSVDATRENGITTGISASERAITLKLLGSSSSTSSDFVRPGHIFPLRARENGVLTRDGHTEAAVDLSRLAGRHPSGVLCEIVSEENPTEMARLPELRRFCEKHGFVLTSIVDLAQYRRDTEL